jgi:hypothetical protein
VSLDFRKDDKPGVQTLDQILAQLDFSSWAIIMSGVTNELTVAAVNAGKSVLTSMQIAGSSPMFDVVDDAGVTYAADRAAELVGMRVLEDGSVVPNPNPVYAITDSTREMLRGTVAQALEEGWSPQQLKTAVKENYAFSNVRALNIARTELSAAHGHGSLAAAKASGVIQSKSWIKGSEHSEPDVCDDNADQGPIPLEDTFTSGDPCEPAHPACSCSVIYHVKPTDADDQDDDSE